MERFYEPIYVIYWSTIYINSLMLLIILITYIIVGGHITGVQISKTDSTIFESLFQIWMSIDQLHVFTLLIWRFHFRLVVIVPLFSVLQYESEIRVLREKIATKRQHLQQNSMKKESFHSRSVLLISTNEKAEQELINNRLAVFIKSSFQSLAKWCYCWSCDQNTISFIPHYF